MKKIYLVLISGLIALVSKGQCDNRQDIGKLLDSLNEYVRRNQYLEPKHGSNKILFKDDTLLTSNDTLLASPPSVNKYFAKKLAYFLSAAKDLSLFNNYAIVDFGDDKAELGFNINVSGNTRRIRNILTLGLTSNVVKGFASVFSDKKVNNEVGADLKFTHVNRGKIRFGKYLQHEQNVMPKKDSFLIPPQKLIMNSRRGMLVLKLKREMSEDWKKDSAYLDDLKSIYVRKPGVIKEECAKSKHALADKYIKAYYEGEEEELSSPDQKVIDKSHLSWFAINVFIPFQNTSYDVVPDLNQTPGTQKSWRPNASISYNSLYEKRGTKLFLNGGISLLKNNTAENEAIEKISIEKFKAISTSGDTALAGKLSSDDVYLGNFETFWTPAISGQIVFYPAKWKVVGIEFTATKKFDKDHALDLLLGFPVALTGKDDEKPINLIFQAKMPDINNENRPKESFWEKFQLGFTLGLPFNSVLK